MDKEFERAYRAARFWLWTFALANLLDLLVLDGRTYVWGPLVLVGYHLGRGWTLVDRRSSR